MGYELNWVYDNVDEYLIICGWCVVFSWNDVACVFSVEIKINYL